MSRIKLTSNIISAAGKDAGMASMRKAGRTKWNLEDLRTAGEAARPLWDMYEAECAAQWEKK